MVWRGKQTNILTGAAACAAVAFALPAGAPARVVAHAARSCSLAGKYASLGPTYVEQLAATGTSCGTGVSLIRGYDRCRRRSGGAKGHCRTPVLGFRCGERRSASSVQFVASVKCSRRRAVVTFTYSENT